MCCVRFGYHCIVTDSYCNGTICSYIYAMKKIVHFGTVLTQVDSISTAEWATAGWNLSGTMRICGSLSVLVYVGTSSILLSPFACHTSCIFSMIHGTTTCSWCIIWSGCHLVDDVIHACHAPSGYICYRLSAFQLSIFSKVRIVVVADDVLIPCKVHNQCSKAHIFWPLGLPERFWPQPCAYMCLMEACLVRQPAS